MSEIILTAENFEQEVLNSEKGTLPHITGIFGLTLAGLVIQDLISGSPDKGL